MDLCRDIPKTNQSKRNAVLQRKQQPFFKAMMQPRLAVNQPNDVYENEADAMADHVMRKPGEAANTNSFFSPRISSVQHKCDHCTQEENEVQRKDSNVEGSASPETERYLSSLSGGRPLSEKERSFFEPRMGYDFSDVRLHTDNAANKSAQDAGALAYTHGNNIVFGSGKYQPGTDEGKKLLAHELTHVVQQNSNLNQKRIQRVSDSDVESGTGVDAGIASGSMVADPIMGQSFDVNCGFKNYSARFRFVKAYRGTYPYKAAGKDVKGVYVKIEMSITDNRYCGRCTPMRALQVLRNTKKGSSGNLEATDPNDPTRRERSGWNNAKAPSRGWRVDTLTTSRDPYYSSTWVGQPGSETTPAIVWDAPGDWSTDTNAGKDFNTSIVCETASGRKWAIGYVHWGYYIDSTGKIAFEPSTPEAFCGYSTQTKDASERWDAISGNTATGITF